MKKITALFLLLALSVTLTACSGDIAEDAEIASASQPTIATGEDSEATTASQPDSAATLPTITVEYDADDLTPGTAGQDTSIITLEGDSISFEGSGVTIGGTTVTISSGGVYSIRGTLHDGQIRVDSQDGEVVILVLNGADISCSTGAPIYVLQAEKTVITLAEGTDNRVRDSDSFILEDGDEPNAAIFSKSDLTINGSGTLTVDAIYNNGITSKDDLKIIGGTIIVNATNDGIKGRDSIAIRDGLITINAGGDGMQSNNDEDEAKGYIVIEGGMLHITAAMDGIQAETRLAVSGGDITIISGGGSLLGPDSSDSAKGLKAGVDVTITGGAFNIDSQDDAIHSNDSIAIYDGIFLLASEDDGVHSDSTLAIHGGELNITASYEGLESSIITINAGNIHIVASDDGINAVSASDSFAADGPPMQGPGNFESGGNDLTIRGGYIAIESGGDGLDINGSISMSGGTVIVNGPTVQMDGPLDYYDTFEITGGFLVAVGSSGMAEAPSASSTQYSLMQIFPSPVAAGTMVHIETEDGQEILTFSPMKEYQSLVISSPDLQDGMNCMIYLGGESTGTAIDGLYSNGIYTAGAQAASITISGIVTGANAMRGGFGPGGQQPPPRP